MSIEWRLIEVELTAGVAITERAIMIRARNKESLLGQVWFRPFLSLMLLTYHPSDRVLFKGSSLRLQEYTRAELMTSDHRPVYAVFEATIREIDRAKKEKIAKELVHGLIKSGGEKKLAAKVGVEIGDGGARDLARGMAKGTSEIFSNFCSWLEY